MSDEQSDQQAGEPSDDEQSQEEPSDDEQSGRSGDEQSREEQSDDDQADDDQSDESEDERSDGPTSDSERFEQLDQRIDSARKTAEDADVLIDADEARYVESGETEEADDQTITPPA